MALTVSASLYLIVRQKESPHILRSMKPIYLQHSLVAQDPDSVNNLPEILQSDRSRRE